MEELIISGKAELRKLINQNKRKIFEFVKKNKIAKIDLNGNLFYSTYKRKGQIGKPTVFLYRILEEKEDDKFIISSFFSEYQIVKFNGALRIL